MQQTEEEVDMEGSQVNGQKKGRIQEGSIHVYFRGNHRNNIFYSDKEKIMFLKLCDKYAKEHLTVIQGFVIMDNHVHLQIQTKQLTLFMKALLYTFSRWYNKENLIRGKLFATPFNSSCKYTQSGIIDSLLYIFQNPLSARICMHPKNYPWSSYNFHFGQRNLLKNIIAVDTSLIENTYNTKYLLDKAIFEKHISIAEIREEQNTGWEKTSYGEIVKFVKGQINTGESVFSLSANELRELVIKIRRTLNASYIQIASVLHINKKQVEDICKGRE